ncbi:hypothetical protein [Streptomyces sp. yr375]|uniref:hypothetical protein n=1 Tax=Streptomyces sp. yr375 TaxID=1761906 RepID=UPI0015A5C57E|nr:hypothetical protein [Streptomyces sp. yr375]
MRRQARFAREPYALSARTLSGRARGRPGPVLGTRIRPTTTHDHLELWASPRCPSVINSDVVSWSCSGSVKTPPGGSTRSSAFAGTHRMPVGAGDGPVHRDVPGHQPLGIGPGVQSPEAAVPGAVPLPTQVPGNRDDRRQLRPRARQHNLCAQGQGLSPHTSTASMSRGPRN